MKKIIPLTIVFLIGVILFTSVSYSTDPTPVDCCINTHPGVAEVNICANGVPVATCCNQNTVGSGGPADIQTCQTNYFNAGGCGAFPDPKPCDMACCCKDSAATDPDKVPRVLCTTKRGGTYTLPDNPSQTCLEVCEGNQAVCPNGICELPQEDYTTCPQDCPTNENCNNPSYVPKITNLDIKADQGSDKMRLTWSDECSSTLKKYTITRCIMPSCSDSKTFPSITENRFVDTDPLLFDTDYQYKIVGEYNNGKTNEAKETRSLGDFECLTQTTANKKFCIQPSYYDQIEIQQYMERADISPNTTTYNSAFQCQDGNKLTLVKTCSEGKACAIINEEAQCLVGGSACNFPEGNPFGLYYTREACEGTTQAPKYCFLDRSTTPVDNCYQCDPSLVCYDYKSRAACLNDNCNIGDGHCQWADVIGSLGIGVCIDTTKDNCDYCSKPGTEGASNIHSFNTVYDICTPEKMSALTGGKGCGCTTPGQIQQCPKDFPYQLPCKQGTQTCSTDLTFGPCTGVVYPAESEICGNSIDDDCNSVVDDGCAETLCDGNDNNGNGLVDEGFGDWDRDNTASCDLEHMGNQPFCGADCIDLDKDGDNVQDKNGPTVIDHQEFTPLGCLVYNQTVTPDSRVWGVGIDNDKDGVCLGLDCSDVNASVNSSCSLSQLCSNQYLDKIIGEEEVDCGGQCPACKIKDMVMKKPMFSIASNYTFTLELDTNRPGTCRYNLDNKDIPYASEFPFDVTGQKNHIVNKFIKISDSSIHKLFVRCSDAHYFDDSNMARFAFNLSVDTTAPTFFPKDPQADPNPIIQIFPPAVTPQTNLLVYTDEPSICKYGEGLNSWAALDKKFEGYDNYTFTKFHQQTLGLPGTAQATYHYYIGCRNAADPELISNLFDRLISVDLLQKIALKDYTRQFFAGPPNDLPFLNISSTKLTDSCFWGESNDESKINNPYVQRGRTNGEYFYTNNGPLTNGSGGLSLEEGNYNYYSICYLEGDKSAILSHSIIIDKTPPSKPIVNDSSKYTNLSEFTYVTNELQLKLTSMDNASGVSYFFYWLEDSKKKVLMNATTTENDHPFYVTGLNLTNGETYYFSAQAYDLAGLISDVGRSDGIKVDTSKIPPSCTDGKKDGDESDLDCGGSCRSCGLNATCRAHDDCLSKTCDLKKVPSVCVGISCEDGVKNGNETDTDCGGSCTKKCDENKKCQKDSDCVQNKCDASSKLCIGLNLCKNKQLDPGETDVDCGGEKCNACPVDSKCEVNDDCSSKWCDPENLVCKTADCFDGKKNGDETGVDCGGLCSSCGGTIGKGDHDSDGLSDQWEQKYCGGDCDPNADIDKDDLTNLQEYSETTDPTILDTDGDGFSDGAEVAAGTDPLDPNSYPKSSFWKIFFMTIGVIILVIAIVYVAFVYLYLPRQRKKPPMGSSRMQEKENLTSFSRPSSIPPIQRSSSSPMTPPVMTVDQIKKRQEIRDLLEKRKAEREAARKKVFEVFGLVDTGKKPEEKKEEKPAEKKTEEKPVPEKKVEVKKDEKDKKIVKAKPKKSEKSTKSFTSMKATSSKESAMERLSKIAKKK